MEAGEIVEQGGKKYLVLGKTFGTKTNLAAGDRFVLEGETLNLERDDEGKVIKASVWVPEVIEATDKGAESLETIVKRAKEHGVLQEKVRHDGGEVEYLPTDAGKPNSATKATDEIERWLEEEHDLWVNFAKGKKGWVTIQGRPVFISGASRISSGARSTAARQMQKQLAYGKRTGYEACAFIDSDGKVIASEVSERGARTGVSKADAKGTDVITHNHVSELPFSDEDVSALLASDANHILAATPSGRVYRLSKTENTKPSAYSPGVIRYKVDFDPLGYPGNREQKLEGMRQAHEAFLKKLATEAGLEFSTERLNDYTSSEKASIASKELAEKAKANVYPDESKKLRFVAQSHYRGRSCHLDLRFEYKRGGDNYLRGWTVAHQVAGAIKAPVTTMGEAKKADANPGNWKMDLKTGLIKPRQIRGGTVRRGDLRAFQKAAEIPADWLNVEGVTEEQDPSEKPPAGATQQFPGVFTILDKGQVEWGAQKPWFSEFFLEGKWKGRWCFRLVKREGEKWFTPTCQDDFDKFFDAKGWITLKDGRRVYSKGPDKGSLNSNRSGSYTGIVYRAVGAEGKVKTALGPATYFSPRQSAAENYGKDVREYHIELDKVLGTNSREYDHVKNVAQNRWTGDKPLAHVINEVAREMKYDAIYAGPTFGLAVFERGRGYEVGPASSEKTNSDKAKILPPGKEEEETRTGSYWVLMQPESQLPYVLSKEATSENWLPPKSVSCLPAKMRKSVPKELQFWTMDRKEALGARSRLAEFEELGGTELKGSKLLILRELTEDA